MAYSSGVETIYEHEADSMLHSENLYEISDAERRQLAILAIEAKAKAYCKLRKTRNLAHTP